jgi:hypothetical protein
MFCRSLFVLLYFFFLPLCCLFFFDIRILITPLVSSNSPSIRWTLFQLYYDENISMWWWCPLCTIQNWNENYRVQSNTLSWFRVNQFLLLLLVAACLVEEQHIPILGLTRPQLKPTIYHIRPLYHRCGSKLLEVGDFVCSGTSEVKIWGNWRAKDETGNVYRKKIIERIGLWDLSSIIGVNFTSQNRKFYPI